MRGRMLPCVRCGRMVAVRSKGLCPACRGKELPPRKTRAVVVRRPARKDKSLSSFFGRHLEILRGVGRSATGRAIVNPTVANICHLYPKRRYKSVAMDDRNIVYLTLEEHTRFDQLLDRMDFDTLLSEFKGVWSAIAGRMVDLAPDVEENGRLKTKLLLWTEKNTIS